MIDLAALAIAVAITYIVYLIAEVVFVIYAAAREGEEETDG